jgi:phage tail sheath protein FI
VPAGELLDVQRALLRFCAARRDLLALLSAPAGHREDDLVEHLRLLEPGDFATGVATAGTVRPLRLSEIEALDFGAFYHPWVTTFPEHRARAGTLALTAAPPEGTVAGSMAALAIRDGAWIAPANRPLDGIFALTPELDRAVRPALLERRVNLLVQEPRGFFACNTDTLAREQEVRPINVRRLLILLRRLALREGNAYVFEPNHEAFRGRVRHRFERVLSHLFVRGALAGANAEQAFRVVVDDSVNTPQTIDRGQFLVELRVAPSRPMKFLSIRLVQDGPERLSVQEI